MATTIKYLQGDTIAFYAEGNDGLNLDTADFEVLHYLQNGSNKMLTTKAQMTQISANKYKGEIPNTTTKNPSIGTYIVEILVGTTKTKVLQEEAFHLGKSQIKSAIV